MHAAKRHPHLARRHDQPRRGGRARHGQALRLRRGRPRDRLSRSSASRSAGARSPSGEVITIDGGDGSVMLGAVPTVEPQAVGRLRDADGLGRPAPPAEGAHQRRDAARCAHRAPLRRRGHRPVPHRAHVLRRSAHRRDARDDPRAATPTAGARRSPRSCRCSARISSSCSRSWPGCRSRSACSTRRCTSSCRTSPRRSRRSRAPPGVEAASRCAGARPSCARSIRCSACAAAGWASCSPRSTRCRRARSSGAAIDGRAGRRPDAWCPRSWCR